MVGATGDCRLPALRVPQPLLKDVRTGPLPHHHPLPSEHFSLKAPASWGYINKRFPDWLNVINDRESSEDITLSSDCDQPNGISHQLDATILQ